MSDVPYPKALKLRPTLRQSLLGKFDSCGLSTKFELDYAQGWSTHPQGRGQLTHRTLARCLEEMHRQGERRIEVDVARAILHEVLRQADVDDICHQPGCNKPARVIPREEREDDGRSLICEEGHRHHSGVANVPMYSIADLYWIVSKWAKDNEFDTRNLVDIEQRMEVLVRYPAPAGGSVERRLTGQLDAWFLDSMDSTHAIVLDWKDTWALPAPTEVSFEGYFQQRFYALLVMRNFNSIQRVTLREFYVRFSEPREVSITRDAIDDIEAEFSALAERFDRALEEDDWRPTPGRHCNFCTRPTKCPIPVFSRGDGRITDEVRAQQVAAQLTVAEVVLKQSRKALQAYVDQHGPVPIADEKAPGLTFFGYQPVERTKRPTVDEVRVAQQTGRPVDSLYKTTTGTKFGRFTLKPGGVLPGVPIAPQWDKAEDEALIAAMMASVEQANKEKS